MADKIDKLIEDLRSTISSENKLKKHKRSKSFILRLEELINKLAAAKKTKNDYDKVFKSLSSTFSSAEKAKYQKLHDKMDKLFKIESELDRYVKSAYIPKNIKSDLNDLKAFDCINDELMNELQQNNIIKNLESIIDNSINDNTMGEQMCCNDIDMSRFVLKTSIPPCSNVIPKQYLEAAKDYNPWISHDDKEKDDDDDEDELYKQKITDKFSIVFIIILVLIVFIIITKVF